MLDRLWVIESREVWLRRLAMLRDVTHDFAKNPIALIVRDWTRPKSDRQRRLFHAVCNDLGMQLGYFPGEMKTEVKRKYFGDDWEQFSTEDLDHEHYGHLIECAYTLAADLEVFIPDRRRG